MDLKKKKKRKELEKQRCLIKPQHVLLDTCCPNNAPRSFLSSLAKRKRRVLSLSTTPSSLSTKSTPPRRLLDGSVMNRWWSLLVSLPLLDASSPKSTIFDSEACFGISPRRMILVILGVKRVVWFWPSPSAAQTRHSAQAPWSFTCSDGLTHRRDDVSSVAIVWSKPHPRTYRLQVFLFFFHLPQNLLVSVGFKVDGFLSGWMNQWSILVRV